MAQLSFALLAAHETGASIEMIAERTHLPESWVRERIAAAQLCLDAELESLPVLV